MPRSANGVPSRDRLVAVITLLVAVPPAAAVPFTPGNILVSNNPFGSTQTLYEVTPAGATVQTIQIPQAADDGARDLTLDRFGNVQIYNGTFSPVLTQYNPTTNVFTHQASQFSTANNLTYGGIASAGDYAFVTDFNTGGSEPSGIVRYSLTGGAPQRFANGREYIDLNVGRNGILYGLRYDGISAGGYTVDRFDPLTLAETGTVTLADVQRAIAVGRNGDIFAVSSQTNDVVHYTPTGQRVKAIHDNAVGGLADIDVDDAGRVLIASHGGGILTTTTELDSLSSFATRGSNYTNFAAWVEPPPAVPEPGTLALMAGASVSMLRRDRNRRLRGR
jgi:hypothetical protein